MGSYLYVQVGDSIIFPAEPQYVINDVITALLTQDEIQAVKRHTLVVLQMSEYCGCCFCQIISLSLQYVDFSSKPTGHYRLHSELSIYSIEGLVHKALVHTRKNH